MPELFFKLAGIKVWTKWKASQSFRFTALPISSNRQAQKFISHCKGHPMVPGDLDLLLWLLFIKQQYPLQALPHPLVSCFNLLQKTLAPWDSPEIISWPLSWRRGRIWSRFLEGLLGQQQVKNGCASYSAVGTG